MCHGRPITLSLEPANKWRNNPSVEQRAIAAGREEILVFADATYQHVIQSGAWAVAAPELGLEATGHGSGPSIDYFELLAALEAISRVLEVDHSHRPVRVHTDSDIAVRLLQSAPKSEPLPVRRSFQRMRSLYDLACDFATRRRITTAKVDSSRAEHADCHLRAAKKMRETLAADPVLAWRLVTGREEARLEAIGKERRALQQRLGALEDEAVLIEARVHALYRVRPIAVAGSDHRSNSAVA